MSIKPTFRTSDLLHHPIAHVGSYTVLMPQQPQEGNISAVTLLTPIWAVSATALPLTAHQSRHLSRSSLQWLCLPQLLRWPLAVVSRGYGQVLPIKTIRILLILVVLALIIVVVAQQQGTITLHWAPCMPRHQSHCDPIEPQRNSMYVSVIAVLYTILHVYICRILMFILIWSCICILFNIYIWFIYL